MTAASVGGGTAAPVGARGVAPAAAPARPRVVIVGAGFGGLAAAKGLAGVDVDVLLIDVNNFHTFQPLLYQVATAGLNADDVAYPVRGTFRRQRNVSVLVGRVTDVDLDGRAVVVDGDRRVGYDTLVVAAGAVSATYGVPGVEQHAVPFKTLADARAVRSQVLGRVEVAAAAVETGEPVDADTAAVAIVGGGPTGVELAGGLVELFDHVLARDFRGLGVRRPRVVLIEGGDRVLAAFAPRLSERAARTLRRRGVELELGTAVAAVEAGVVVLADGRRVRAGTIVWAAGVRASPLAALLGPTGRGGRVEVTPELTVPGHPEVFVVGDLAATRGPDGEVLPQVSQPAIQGGAYAARVIAGRCRGEEVPAFRYHDRGSAATIGRHAAVFEFPRGLTLSGPVGWFAWLALHLVYLVGFRNRLRVLVSWGWEYLTWDRGNRIVGADLDGA